MEKNNIVVETLQVGALDVNCSMIYSKESKKAIAIDAGNDERTIINYLEERGLELIKLIHTHAHFDHIGSSAAVKEKTGAELSLHKLDNHLYQELEGQGKMFGIDIPRPTTPDVIFEEGDSFSLTGSDLDPFLQGLKIIHTPGHTEGSCCLYSEFFDRPILFAGDTLFFQSIGRTDLPGGSFDAIIDSITNKLFKLPDETIVITGHGPGTTIGNEKKLNPFIR